MKLNTTLGTIILVWLMVIPLCQSEAQDATQSTYRSPAVAGSFYPSRKADLETSLKELFNKAEHTEIEGRIQCLVVPHAGYPYSGVVAASGYKSIPRNTAYDNIFLIASSHREQFNGASVYAVGDYLTPLGLVPVNLEIASDLIAGHNFISYYPSAHNREHSIEVQLPFIQYHLEKMPPIIPIVIGSSSVSTARELAAALLPFFNGKNLFIISSDFSHYPEYNEAVRIDKLTAGAILTKDPEIFYNTLRKNNREPVKNLATPCCGWSSVLTMLYMADRRDNLQLTGILYRNSGDAPIGDRNRVVGYWAIAGHLVNSAAERLELTIPDREILLRLSRETLERFLLSNELTTPEGISLSPALKQEAGAFVSLYMGGKLRGCIGNFFGTKPLYQMVQEMTIAAATKDPRFAPVQPPELDYITIEISVLTPLKKILSIEEFEPGRHGIFMTKDGQSGTYLPQVALKTGWSAEELLGHCAREKARIGWDGWKDADLFVYEAIVFGEEKLQ